MQDNEIVDLFISRDESAISFVQEKYGKRIFTLAYGILHDAEASKEIENDTYFQAWNLIPPHEPRSYLFPFLGRIARHLAIDRLRIQKAMRRSAEICELTDEISDCYSSENLAIQNLSESVLLEAINDFLRKSNKTHMRIFVRRYWFFDSIQDTSHKFNISESNVKQILFRMRKKLHKELEKRGLTP